MELATLIMVSIAKIEQIFLEKLRALPPDKQQEVLDFADFLIYKLAAQPLPADRQDLPIESSLQLDAVLKLPLEERRQLLAKQAEALVNHYQQHPEWQELSAGDIIEY